MNEENQEFVILRSRDQGVMCGFLVSIIPQPGGLACGILREARQIHGWQQNNENYTLVELANNGVVPPATARISEKMDLPFTMFGVCGVYRCTTQAQENLSQSRWNQPFGPSTSKRKVMKRHG